MPCCYEDAINTPIASQGSPLDGTPFALSLQRRRKGRRHSLLPPLCEYLNDLKRWGLFTSLTSFLYDSPELPPLILQASLWSLSPFVIKPTICEGVLSLTFRACLISFSSTPSDSASEVRKWVEWNAVTADANPRHMKVTVGLGDSCLSYLHKV